MPKTTFVKGTKVTKEFLNAINAIVFDGADLDGHNPKLTNASFDNSPGALLNDWTAFKNALGVTSTAGLVATYTGGTVTLPTGTIATIAPGTIALANSATNYLYIDRTGTLVASLVYPSIGVPIAQITTVGGAISGSIIDLRPRYQILPVPQAIRVFGGLGGEGSLAVTTGNTVSLSGEHRYTDITVQVGATLTINGSASLYCLGNVQIDGIVNVIPLVKGGQGYFGGLKAQDYPNTAGSGVGGGNSVNQPASPAYDYFASPLGSGGAGGWVAITSTTLGASLTTPRGGNGGGCLIIEAAGTINITGTIRADGENGQGNTSVVQNPAASYTAQISGGGGGSGGLLFFKSLKSITASAAAILSVAGGIGGNGFPNPTTQFSAGGGGGGYLALYSPNNNTTGATLNLSGGSSPYATGFGSVAGGSFGGVGGAAGQPGSSGILVLRSIVPV